MPREESVTSPAKRWRSQHERFDRTLGFVLGAAVGFPLVAFAAANALEASGWEAIGAGLAGAVLLGTCCAVLGEKVLERLLWWF